VPLTGFSGAFGLYLDDNSYLGRQTHSSDGMKAQPDWALDVLDHNGMLLRTIKGFADQQLKQEAR